jgi:hypothetical protein
MAQKYSAAFIEGHRDFNIDHRWWESTFDNFETICTILGIALNKNEPNFSGFWSQGDGASWAGRYRSRAFDYRTNTVVPTYDLAPAQIREHAPQDEELHRIADELCLLARIYGPTYAVVGRSSNRSVHSGTMYINEWEYDDDRDSDDVDGVILDHIEEALLAMFTALAEWLYTSLDAEYDYLTSDEAVIEALEANEVEEEAGA